MPDFRVSDTAADHPKLRAAGIAAAGLWAMAGSWSMNPARLTDGWIPHHYVKSWPNGVRAARRLVQVGLWTEDNRRGEPGYQYHDWADYQRIRAAFDEDKRKARERMQARRSTRGARDVRANTHGTALERSGSVQAPPSPSPSPSTYVGQGGATFVGASEPSPPRCLEHLDEPAPGPCGKCADARRARAAWDADAEARRLEVATAIDAARADPRMQCRHGADGGKFIHPATGKSATCQHCRAEQTRDTA